MTEYRCPHCGSKAVKSFPIYMDNEDDKHIGECQSCYATGPMMQDATAALEEFCNPAWIAENRQKKGVRNAD